MSEHTSSDSFFSRKTVFSLLFLLTFFSFLYAKIPEKSTVLGNLPFSARSAELSFGDTAISAEIVRTPAELALGLGGKNSLEENSGMLFIFPTSGFHGIWMKDMKFSIDIIWLDLNFSVVHIKSDATPDSYPQVFYSRVKDLYVLEVSAGFAEKIGLKVGDKFKINRTHLKINRSYKQE